jgi:hypothetical protein
VLELMTMGDARFLAQVVTLHRSLLVHAGPFRLTVICLDDPSLGFLRRRRLAHVEPFELESLERADPALTATRSRRTWTEYCWTVTPAFCRHVVERAPAGAVVLWVDADVEFVRSPRLLVDALGDGSVLLTPHRYNRAYPTAALPAELTAGYGRFNGGTIAFRADAEGLAAARLWRERTLRWCYDRCEPGRYGNQLHLDDFPQRFSRARVLGVPGGVLGPWNGGRFRVLPSAGGPVANGRPVIAYHYQSLRLGRARPRAAAWLSRNVFALAAGGIRLEARVETHYRLGRGERSHFWRPHLGRLAGAVAEVLVEEPRFAGTLAPLPTRAQALAVVRQGLALRAGRVLPFWHTLRVQLISVAALALARALRRRGRRRR